MTHHTLAEIEARFADLGDGRIGARVHLGASDSADCPGGAGQASTSWVLVGPGVVTFYRDQAHEIVSHGTAWLTRTPRPGLSEPEGPPHIRQATDHSQPGVVDRRAREVGAGEQRYADGINTAPNDASRTAGPKHVLDQ